MNTLFKKTIVKFTFFTLAIAIISLMIQLFITSLPISNVWPYILGFMYLVTILAFYMLIKYLNSKISMFANAFMLVNFGKLILFTIIIFVYSWLNRSDAITFTITFFIYYLFLTTFEIISLLKIQKG